MEEWPPPRRRSRRPWESQTPRWTPPGPFRRPPTCRRSTPRSLKRAPATRASCRRWSNSAPTRSARAPSPPKRAPTSRSPAPSPGARGGLRRRAGIRRPGQGWSSRRRELGRRRRLLVAAVRSHRARPGRRRTCRGRRDARGARAGAFRGGRLHSWGVRWRTSGARRAAGAGEGPRRRARANWAQADARFRAGLSTAVELADAEEVLAGAEINVALGVFEVARTRAIFGRAIAEGLHKMGPTSQNDAPETPRRAS